MASDRPGIFRILDLPTDILHLILEEFQHDRATLLNLTLVCRPISAIARPLVFWHLDDATEDDIPILQILFDERPELKLYVRSCPPTVFDAEGCPSVNDEGKPPWLCFPNLHQLNLQRDGKDYDLGFPWEDEEDDDLDKYPKQRTIENAIKISLIPDSLSNVRSVTLNSTADSDGFGGTYSVADFSLIDIIHLLMLPNIRRLRANRLGPLGTLPNLDSFRQTPSSITCLEVYGSSHWSCEPWQIAELLSFCPCLRKLGCFMPMLTVYPEPPIGGLTELVCREVCPAAFDRMLEPVKNTLTHLSLIDWRYETQYDGTFMDFRTYPSLEILEINACCVLPPGAPGPERAKMFERLPKSLRALVVRKRMPSNTSIRLMYSSSLLSLVFPASSTTITSGTTPSRLLRTSSTTSPKIGMTSLRRGQPGFSISLRINRTGFPSYKALSCRIHLVRLVIFAGLMYGGIRRMRFTGVSWTQASH